MRASRIAAKTVELNSRIDHAMVNVACIPLFHSPHWVVTLHQRITGDPYVVIGRGATAKHAIQDAELWIRERLRSERLDATNHFTTNHTNTKDNNT